MKLSRSTSTFVFPVLKDSARGKLRIEKFIDGKHETTIRVPTFLIGVAKTLLPESALVALAKRGIDVPAIAAAKSRGVAYSAAIDVREHGTKHLAGRGRCRTISNPSKNNLNSIIMKHHDTNGTQQKYVQIISAWQHLSVTAVLEPFDDRHIGARL